MLFFWLRKGWRWVLWLLKAPNAADVVRIKRNAKCPVCGARRGRLACVSKASTAGGQTGLPREMIYCQHQCQECGAQFYEEPVVKLEPGMVETSSASPRAPRKVQGMY